MFFLRKVNLDTEPLAIKMSGVRLGEKLLQVGADDPQLLAQLALKIGLSGTTTVLVEDAKGAEHAKDAAARAGALIDLKQTAFDVVAADPGAYDVVVIHSTKGLMASLWREGRADAVLNLLRDALRHGGRVIVIEAGPKSGVGAMLKPYKPDEEYEGAGGAVRALETAGFRPVRLLSERDGYRFVEGLKT